MNNIRIGYSPFTEGFLEELKKVKDARVEGYLRIIERLNLETREASKRICNEALNDESAAFDDYSWNFVLFSSAADK
jgi:hypothetical protein